MTHLAGVECEFRFMQLGTSSQDEDHSPMLYTRGRQLILPSSPAALLSQWYRWSHSHMITSAEGEKEGALPRVSSS